MHNYVVQLEGTILVSVWPPGIFSVYLFANKPMDVANHFTTADPTYTTFPLSEKIVFIFNFL